MGPWKGSLRRLLGKAPWKGSLRRLLGRAPWKGSLERLPGKVPWKGSLRRLLGKAPEPVRCSRPEHLIKREHLTLFLSLPPVIPWYHPWFPWVIRLRVSIRIHPGEGG